MAAPPRRDDSRIIIHFDYDCFYASVVENENPALKSLPLAIQQKQIVVTCNYEARSRGLHKLQLITEAKKICPDVVIVLGEDLTRFRDASKELYNFLQQSIWSGRAEKLGFDEVWLDCTDMIDYNCELLNPHDLMHSFFCLDRNDPTVGFSYDAREVYGPTYPQSSMSHEEEQLSHRRLVLGSHLARHLRHELERKRGYTATVGISTNKLLSKLVGNINKPKNQTTLLPEYDLGLATESHINAFMGFHDIGRVPGIGFKLSQKIKARVLGRTPVFDQGLIYGGTKEAVTVRDVRLFAGMGPEMLEEILSGPGSQKGIGGKIWNLMNGIDDSEVGKTKTVPSQISIEDSYTRLVTFEEVKKELLMLSKSLIRRMHTDLTVQDEFDLPTNGQSQRRWLANPRTLRLSTRPRRPWSADGSRARSFNRISRSFPMPNFVFNLNESVDILAEKLVQEAFIPAFRKLHPERSGWNLSVVNIAVMNMAETATDTKDSAGRDIGRMLKKQDDVLKDFKVSNKDGHGEDSLLFDAGADSPSVAEQDGWNSDVSADESAHTCETCALVIPSFATAAHDRYHEMSS